MNPMSLTKWIFAFPRLFFSPIDFPFFLFGDKIVCRRKTKDASMSTGKNVFFFDDDLKIWELEEK